VKESIKLNPQKVVDPIFALLNNTYFEGFTFDTSFTLRFGRISSTEFKGIFLPLRVQLCLLSDWRFNSKEDWQQKILQFPQNDSVEPDEPVQAYELANLRWMNESIVNSVSFEQNELFISFKNGKKIFISCNSTEGEAWILSEYNVDESEEKWSIVCENCEFFVKTPKVF
jgi:hypothetical protein